MEGKIDRNTLVVNTLKDHFAELRNELRSTLGTGARQMLPVTTIVKSEQLDRVESSPESVIPARPVRPVIRPATVAATMPASSSTTTTGNGSQGGLYPESLVATSSPDFHRLTDGVNQMRVTNPSSGGIGPVAPNSTPSVTTPAALVTSPSRESAGVAMEVSSPPVLSVSAAAAENLRLTSPSARVTTPRAPDTPTATGMAHFKVISQECVDFAPLAIAEGAGPVSAEDASGAESDCSSIDSQREKELLQGDDINQKETDQGSGVQHCPREKDLSPDSLSSGEDTIQEDYPT